MKLRQANEQDLSELAGWFLTESDAKNWGGPSIRFPLRPGQLIIDIEWHAALSYALVDDDGNLLGFAQVFNKFGCNHLGRIVISPEQRGRKLGRTLMTALLESCAGDDVNVSLFVYEDNIPAKKLYQSLRFEVRAYPKERSEIQGCIFMVKET